MRSSGDRAFMRRMFACGPAGCGARPGEPCAVYRGPSSGAVLSDVHRARWRAYRTWLARPRGGEGQP